MASARHSPSRRQRNPAVSRQWAVSFPVAICSGAMAEGMSSRIFAPGLLDGQICVVSGAGTGLGRATALELTALGATVIGCGRRPEPLEGMVQDASGRGGKAEFEVLDIREEEAVDGFMDGVVERHGRIDLLVN